jgi:hypothetical protein
MINYEEIAWNDKIIIMAHQAMLNLEMFHLRIKERLLVHPTIKDLHLDVNLILNNMAIISLHILVLVDILHLIMHQVNHLHNLVMDVLLLLLLKIINLFLPENGVYLIRSQKSILISFQLKFRFGSFVCLVANAVAFLCFLFGFFFRLVMILLILLMEEKVQKLQI